MANILTNMVTMLFLAAILQSMGCCVWSNNGRVLVGLSRWILKGLERDRAKAKSEMAYNNTATTAISDEMSIGEHADEQLEVLSEAETMPSSTVMSQKSSSRKSNRRKIARQTSIREWFYSWLILDKDYLLNACGVDAMEYLIFQRYLIGLLAMLTIISLTIILPINKYGGPNNQANSNFSSTTLDNIDVNSLGLWYHATVSLFFYFICVATMKEFAQKLRYLEDRSIVPSRTLILSGLPDKIRSELDVIKHLKSEYPGISIKEVSFCLRVTEVTALLRERAFYEIVLKIIDRYGQKFAKTWKSRCFGCLCPRLKVSSKDDEFFQTKYYEKQIMLLDMQIIHCLHEIDSQLPLDSAFVTLNNPHQAREVLMFHKYRKDSPKYSMKFAPPAHSVMWGNITPQYWVKTKEWIADLLLIIFVIVISSPEFLAQVFSEGAKGQVLTEYVTDGSIRSTINLAMGLITQQLVFWSSSSLGYWTEGKLNRKLLTKSYIILIIKFFFFPMLNLTSLIDRETSKFIQWDSLKFKCLFLPDNGALYINHMATMTLLSNSCALLRLDLLMQHLSGVIQSRSWSEMLVRVRRVSRTKFFVGENMVWLLINVTITVSLSISCPLITPVGLAYVLIRHYVDSYNLIMGYYIVAKVDTKRMYQRAVSIVMFAACCLQISNVLFFLVQTETGGPKPETDNTNSHQNLSDYDAPTYFSTAFSVTAIIFWIFQVMSNHSWPLKIFEHETIFNKVPKKKIMKMEKPYFPPLLKSYMERKKKQATERASYLF